MSVLGVATVVLMLLTAVGITVFWVTWLRNPQVEEWAPVGYLEHERPFVFPDAVMAGLLAVSGGLLTAGNISVGAPMALVAAGMLLFLGIIDGAYFAQNGLFHHSRGGAINTGIVVATVLVAGLIVASYATDAWGG